MKIEQDILNQMKRIRALAQNGLVYSTNEYDTERYTELINISDEVTALLTEHDVSTIHDCFKVETDYVTPKVDVRAVVFNEHDEILLVQEKADGRWSLPGGWADVGYAPTEIAVKEVKEETGLDVSPVRLLAILDKRCHPYPPAPHYAYKIFILCHIEGGRFNTAFDILDRGFFAQNALPPLSEERVIKEHIDLMYEYLRNPQKPALVD